LASVFSIFGAGVEAGFGSGFAGFAAAALALTWPMTVPTFTVPPCGISICSSTPAAGDGTSTLTLSVSSSTIVSSCFDGIAFLLQPAGDGGFGDGFPHRRHFDFNAHLGVSSAG